MVFDDIALPFIMQIGDYITKALFFTQRQNGLDFVGGIQVLHAVRPKGTSKLKY